MLYTDTFFLGLLALLCLVTHLLRPWPEFKEWLLIGASLLLIATWGTYDLVLFLAVLTINFGIAVALSRVESGRGRVLLAAAIGLDLATLALFKYANFFGGGLGTLLHLHFPEFPLGIPLAISFYVFHLISYLVDLHKKRVRVATLREYLFYLSFFPHVIAGPIVRAWQLVPQIGVRGPTRRVRTDWVIGSHYLVVGYFFKAIVANNLAAHLDPIWARAVGFNLTSLEHWVVAFLYYCQIYGDFAGYSLMALGMARLLGYRLPANFRTPMLAASLQEFWRRWHITLSRWLRDYLYIPLGGNWGGAARGAATLCATMLLGGLWHGAGWGFVVWGAMHGVGLAVERAFGFHKLPRGTLRRLGWWLAVQLWVMAAWVAFREPSLFDAYKFARHLVEPSLTRLVGHPLYYVHPLFLIPLLFALPVILHHGVPFFLRRLPRRHLGTFLGLSTGLLLMINFLVYAPVKTFIYFKF